MPSSIIYGSIYQQFNVTYEGYVDMSNVTVILPQNIIDDGVFTSLINNTPTRSEVKEIVKEVLREMMNNPY